MREPIPFVTGPGTIILVYSLIFLFSHDLVDLCPDSITKITFLALVALSVGPLFNLVFHPVWLLLGGYQTFGQQRLYLQQGYPAESIAIIFDKYLYQTADTKDPKENGGHNTLDYARRRTAGYLLHLQAQYAVAFSMILYLTMGLMYGLTIDAVIIVVLISLLGFILFYSAKEIIHRELMRFEREMLKGDLAKIQKELSALNIYTKS